MNLDGSNYQILHDFGPLITGDGLTPVAIMEGSDGALYGTTQSGGTNLSGTAFRINRDGGQYSILHHFRHSDDGAQPVAGLVEGSDRALYGTTSSGGANGGGTVFKFNKDGTGFVTLHSFSHVDGAEPEASLVEGSDGKLYGTTRLWGQTNGGSGTVFRLNKDGIDFSTLYSFASNLPKTLSTNGANPVAALI
jgi:uncharacterized repeat protein (TIGR03803 family)